MPAILACGICKNVIFGGTRTLQGCFDGIFGVCLGKVTSKPHIKNATNGAKDGD
jgi:hypothetical protein